MCMNKELGTFGFTCMIALLVVEVLHRLSCYRAQVVGFRQILSAHIKYARKKHAWEAELEGEKKGFWATV